MKLRQPRKNFGIALGLGLALVAFAAKDNARAGDEAFPIAQVAPGMNRTELNAVMGPPTYIQVKGLREAWQYCPRPFFIRRFDEYMRAEDALFVTVWFNEGRVEHMRAYPGKRMGMCEDFLAAFSWEDVIQGGGFVAGGYPFK